MIWRQCDVDNIGTSQNSFTIWLCMTFSRSHFWFICKSIRVYSTEYSNLTFKLVRNKHTKLLFKIYKYLFLKHFIEGIFKKILQKCSKQQTRFKTLKKSKFWWQKNVSKFLKCDSKLLSMRLQLNMIFVMTHLMLKQTFW